MSDDVKCVTLKRLLTGTQFACFLQLYGYKSTSSVFTLERCTSSVLTRKRLLTDEDIFKTKSLQLYWYKSSFTGTKVPQVS